SEQAADDDGAAGEHDRPGGAAPAAVPVEDAVRSHRAECQYAGHRHGRHAARAGERAQLVRLRRSPERRCPHSDRGCEKAGPAERLRQCRTGAPACPCGAFVFPSPRPGRIEKAMKRTLILAASLLALPAIAQQNSADPAKLPGRVAIQQKLDTQIPLDTMFRDETGRVVRLSEYFRSGRPVLLNFMYYRCPMLCPTVLEGTTNTLTELKFDIGREFDVITVSIDPRDTPEMAAQKKDHYLKRYGRLNSAAGWHFLTGNESSIKRLANAVGFEYAYDLQSDQFAHGAALLVLTPQGKVSRYFYGFEYSPRDLRLGLVEAAANKIGTATDQFMLLCFHYDPATGKYAKTAMNIVRAGGVATIISLASFIFIMLRNERKSNQ